MIYRLAACAAAAIALVAAAPLRAQAAPAAPTAAPAAASISVEDFARLPFLSDALLSPDGTRIAGRVSQGGAQHIAIWTVGAPADRQPVLIPSGGSDSFVWAGDRRLLITVDFSFIIRIGTGIYPILLRRVSSYDLDAQKAVSLGSEEAFRQEAIFVDPAGRYVLLSSQANLEREPNVLRIDLATGTAVEVQPRVHGVWSWFADAEGIVRVGVTYGERRTRFYYRAAPGAELRLIDTRRNVDDDSVIDMVRFVSNTDRGIIVTNAETGRFAIYDYDFATDTRGPALFAHPEVDVTQAIFGRDGSLDGVFYEDDRPRVRWLDADMARLQERIDRTLAGHTNMIINSSRDGNRVLLFSSAADDPGTYYVFDQAARRMEIFASPYDVLVGRRFAEVRPVSYTSTDGSRIPAYLTLPPGPVQRGLPLVVLPHGGPFARDSWMFDPQVQFLASRGYAVLQPNFRGSTGYGRAFVERGYGQLGTGMIDDVDAGVDWLVQQGIVDASRVCIMGGSYGGYAAVRAAMRSPGRYRCAISFAGPSDWRSMIRYNSQLAVPQRYVREWRQRVRGEEQTDLDSISTLRHPQLLRVPLLLAHGEQDLTVPIEQSRRLARALERAHAPVETVFYPKSGHGFTDAAESADFMRRVEAFLARHNPAATPPAAPAPAASAAGVPISAASR
ncbi:MAG TPA: S9 family peptidase [Allosphingosinicella sp.]|jgi:dienelactone hydrolase|nr:S9 family peptidase [Allosphingosinicella sp.]